MLRNVCEHDWESSIFLNSGVSFLHVTPRVLSYECHVCKRFQFSSVAQLCLTLCNPMTAAPQASLSITNSQSLLKLISMESVMPSDHLTLCCPLLGSSTFPSIRAFLMSQPFASSGQSVGASALASNEYSGLSSFRIN